MLVTTWEGKEVMTKFFRDLHIGEKVMKSFLWGGGDYVITNGGEEKVHSAHYEGLC